MGLRRIHLNVILKLVLTSMEHEHYFVRRRTYGETPVKLVDTERFIQLSTEKYSKYFLMGFLRLAFPADLV